MECRLVQSIAVSWSRLTFLAVERPVEPANFGIRPLTLRSANGRAGTLAPLTCWMTAWLATTTTLPAMPARCVRKRL